MARDLEATLLRSGIDACAPVHQEVRSLRAGIWRSLAPRASLVVAIWSQSDGGDNLFLETFQQAARTDKLLAASCDGEPLPASATPVAGGIEALRREVMRRLARTRAPSVAREYAQLRNACVRGGAKAWRALLRAHPDGVFQAVARAELEMALAPGYRAQGMHFPDVAAPWRMRRQRGIWGLAVGALGTAVLAVYVLRPPAGGDPATTEQPAQAVEPLPFRQFAFDADPAPPNQEAPALPAELPTPIPPRRSGARLLASPLAPMPLADTPEPLAPAIASAEHSAIAAQPAGFEPTRAAPATRAYDPAQVEPGLRAVMEQARRRQSYAHDRAARSAGARDLDRAGRYRGDWANGGPDGLGAASWADGARYEGSWREAKPDGMGVLSLAGGIRYEGEFDSGSPTGRGVFWSGDGQRITGAALFRALVAARSAGSAPLSNIETGRSPAEN